MKKVFIFLVVMIFCFPVLAKNCKKGIPCGNSCISASKTCHIGSSSYNSYSYSGSTTSSQVSKAALIYYNINGNGINVYTAEDTKSKIKFILNKNDKVRVLSTGNLWYKILSQKGDGFILKQNKDGYNSINK
ncbi:SH3 domain-containing protein [Orbus mooreae]|uniref:SH3 domain-containing protein n=1 Tax=Orbus mooreae TaxID=3074107 RepID=UPI00370DE2A1